jgi:tetratricopeptide (TPR) repeat protein
MSYLPQAIEDASIDGRIDIILDEFMMAIQWGRPCISFAVYRSEHVKKNTLLAIKQALVSKEKEVIQLDVNKKLFDIPLVIRDYPDGANKVFSISGLRWGGGRGYSNAYRALNMHREHLIESKALSLFWLTAIEAKQLAKYAPDFWAFRHLVVEFSDLPSIPVIKLPSNACQDNKTIIETHLAFIKNNPDNIQALTGIAKLYYALGCYDDAVRYFRKALRITPDDTILSLFLAEVYRSMKRPCAAARIIRKLPVKNSEKIKEELRLLSADIVSSIDLPVMDRT